MKFAKTFCRPSACIDVIPVGLPIKLQYNERGLLQQLYIGFSVDLDPTYELIDQSQYSYKELFDRVKKFVPNSITLTGGTTWVYGVLYSDSIPCDEGLLPLATLQSYITDVIAGGSYTFYAGYVHSLAASFHGPIVIRNFLSGAKFDLLPQVIVPVSMTDDTLEMLTRNTSYPFRYEYIAGFFIFEDLNCRYASANLSQINVTNDIIPEVGEDGYLRGVVVSKSGDKYNFGYSSIARHNVSKGCTLLLEKADSFYNILANRLGTGLERVPDSVGRDVTCPVCGKKYIIGLNDAPVQCDDPHCLSHQFGTVKKMLDTLKLPSIDYAQYKEWVDKKQILCITDVLEVQPYKDVEIETTLANAMYSVIPADIVPQFDILERFANKCNNNIDSVKYYLNNPLKIQTDLDIVDPLVRKLAAWLSDPYNVSTLETIFSRAHIEEKIAKFDGAPIFRGNKIVITGKFKRGDYPEIASILASYAADVAPSIELGDKLPDVVVTGSLNDGISGQVIQKARAHNIPIIDEDEFFVQYEIDQDLAANLL